MYVCMYVVRNLNVCVLVHPPSTTTSDRGGPGRRARVARAARGLQA